MVGEHIYDEIRDYWSQCSDSVRSAYGEEFFDSTLVKSVAEKTCGH
jgi:hypothetical protein